jgi:hypothetical protein
MAISLGDAILNLDADDRKLNSTVDKASKNIQTKFSKAAKIAGAAFVGLGVAVGASMVKILNDTAKAGDEVAKAATRVNMSTKAFSALKHAAELSGASIVNLENGLKFMQKSMVGAAEGNKNLSDAFNMLGLNAQKLMNMEPEQAMMNIADALNSVDNNAKRTELAMSIFGAKAGPMLSPMLSQGTAGIQEMMQEAERLGIVFDSKSGKAAEAYTDAMTRLKASFEGVKFAIAMELFPILIPFIEKMVQNISKAAEWIKNNKELATTILTVGLKVVALSTALGGLLLVAQPFITVLGGMIKLFGLLNMGSFALSGTIGTGAVGVAGGTGLVGAIASLGAVILPLVVVGGALFILGKILKDLWQSSVELKKAEDQLADSNVRLGQTTEIYAEQLRKKGVVIDENLMKEMSANEKIAYLRQQEKEEMNVLARAWFEYYTGKQESVVEFERMKSLMLNKEIGAEEAAILASKNLSNEKYLQLLRADKERTEQILINLGVREQASKNSESVITDTIYSAAAERQAILQKADQDTQKMAAETAGYVGDYWGGVLQRLKEVWNLSQYITNPVGKMWDAGKDLLGIGNNASGTDNWRGGLTWVGERGPELLNLPSGSQIFSNSDSKAMAGNTINNNFTINGGNSSPKEIADMVAFRINQTMMKKGAF